MMQRLPDSQEAAAHEALRAAKLCNPRFDTVGHLTLFVDAQIKPSWQGWRDKIFLPHLLPALNGVRVAWESGDLEAVEAIDAGLNLLPGVGDSEFSSRAGRLLALDFTPPAGAKLFARYRSHIEAGRTPGHLVCVHAARASLFHIAPRTAIVAYLLQEALSISLPEGSEGLLAMVSDCVAAGPQDSTGLLAA